MVAVNSEKVQDFGMAPHYLRVQNDSKPGKSSEISEHFVLRHEILDYLGMTDSVVYISMVY